MLSDIFIFKLAYPLSIVGLRSLSFFSKLFSLRKHGHAVFSTVKKKIISQKLDVFTIFLLQKWIVGTRWNRFAAAVLSWTMHMPVYAYLYLFLSCTLNLCLDLKQKQVYPGTHKFYCINVGFKGVYFLWTRIPGG